MTVQPQELIWSTILLGLAASQLIRLIHLESSTIWSSAFVLVAAILGTLGRDVTWRSRTTVLLSVAIAFNAARFGIPPRALTTVLVIGGSVLMMEAFRPPAGSQKKQFSWTLFIIALGVLAFIIWFVPEYLMPMLGVPVTN